MIISSTDQSESTHCYPLNALDSFVCQFQRLNGDVVAFSSQGGPSPFTWPGADEVPSGNLLAGSIKQDNGAVLPFKLTLHCLAMPVVELLVVGEAPLEHDVAVFGDAWEFAQSRILASLSVLNDINRRVEATALVKRSSGDAINLDQEVKIVVRIRNASGSHI